MTGNGTAELEIETFKTAFAAVAPLITKEWPDVDAKALDATGGDADKVVDLVSEKTQHTKTLVRRQLAELHRLATPEDGGAGPVKDVLDRLEKKTAELSAYLKDSLLPKTTDKLHQNLLVSLMCALGLGVVIGVVLRSLGRGR